MSDLRINILAQDKTKQAFSSVQKNVGGVKTSLFSLKNILLAVAGSVVIREFGRLSNEFQNLQNRLKLVTGSTSELVSVQNKLFDISQRTRGGFSETVELYQKLALQSRNLGLKQSELSQITENVNKTIAIAGVGSVQASSGILQLSQAFASGRLQGDEFRSISENIPPLLDIFAKELKVTRGELKKLGAEGKITSDIIARALLKETDNLSKQFEQLSPTIGQSTTVLKNSFLNLVGVFNEVTGVADKLSASFIKMSEFIDGLTESLKPLPNEFGAVSKEISKMRKELEMFEDPESYFAYQEQADKIDVLTEKYKELASVFRVGGGADISQIESLDEIGKKLESNTKKVKKKKQEYQNIHEAYLKHQKQVEVNNKLHIDIHDQLQKHNEQFSLSSEIFSTLTSTVSSFSRGIAESIVLGKSMAETFKKIAQRLLIEIIAKTIERIALLAIEKLLIDKIFKQEDNRLDTEKKITREKQKQVALQTILVALGGGGGGFFSSFFGKASGGAVSKGQPELVGERGPELFIPNSTGQITQSARGTGGGAVNVNFNINTVDASGFEDLLFRSRGTITQLINSAVNERGRESLI